MARLVTRCLGTKGVPRDRVWSRLEKLKQFKPGYYISRLVIAPERCHSTSSVVHCFPKFHNSIPVCGVYGTSKRMR